jgi:hypothetical protein
MLINDYQNRSLTHQSLELIRNSEIKKLFTSNLLTEYGNKMNLIPLF